MFFSDLQVCFMFFFVVFSYFWKKSFWAWNYFQVSSAAGTRAVLECKVEASPRRFFFYLFFSRSTGDPFIFWSIDWWSIYVFWSIDWWLIFHWSFFLLSLQNINQDHKLPELHQRWNLLVLFSKFLPYFQSFLSYF